MASPAKPPKWCPACNGDGIRAEADGRDVKCADCRATGLADPTEQNDALGGYSDAEKAGFERADAAYDAGVDAAMEGA